MAAVPSIGRAERVNEPVDAAGAQATQSLFERFSGQIFGYCLHQLGSREDAEDAVQTTFMNAFRGLKRGIVPEIESAWLFKIAHNVCLSRRRSSWRRGRVEAPNNMEVLQEVVPARERDDDELMRLQDVLEGMPEGQRRAILLREWQGLSYREIADELELTQAAVETLIFRARRTLASRLVEEEPVVEERSWRKRARHGVDAGGLLAAFKTLFVTGTAAKVGVTAAAVVSTAVFAGNAAEHHRHIAARPAHAIATAPAPTTRVASAPVTRSEPTRHIVRAVVPVAVHRAPAHGVAAPRHAPPSPAVSRPAAPQQQSASIAPPPEHVATPLPTAPKPMSARPAAKPAKAAKVHKEKPLHVTGNAAVAASAPPADAAHGQATAPGQQDKAPKPDKPDNGAGNGVGNGHK